MNKFKMKNTQIRCNDLYFIASVLWHLLGGVRSTVIKVDFLIISGHLSELECAINLGQAKAWLLRAFGESISRQKNALSPPFLLCPSEFVCVIF